MLPVLPICAQTDAFWSVAADGLWTTGTNWSVDPAVPFNGFPNPLDRYHAWINAVGAPYTVTLDFAIEVNALTLDSEDATLHHTAGLLTLNGGLLELRAGQYLLDGGSLANMTITSSGGTFVVGTGDFSLEGVTLDQIDLSIAGGQTVSALNSFIVNSGTVIVGDGGAEARLLTSGEDDLGGSGLFLLNNGEVSSYDTLRISEGTVLRAVGQSSNTIDGDDRITNRGTISADGTGNAIRLTAPVLVNSALGRIEAVNGGEIINDVGIFDNRGEVHIGAGSEWTVGNLINTGTITADPGASIYLNDLGLASNLGSFSLQGAYVQHDGVLDLEGQAFLLNGAEWNFDRNSLVSNGTFTDAAGGFVSARRTNVRFNNVVFDTDFLIPSGASVLSDSGIEVTAGHAIIMRRTLEGGSSNRPILTTASLTGAGELRFEGEGAISGTAATLSSPIAPLMIGAGFTVRAVSANASFPGPVFNEGTIRAENGYTLSFNQNGVENHGLIEAVSGGVMVLDSVDNQGLLRADTFGALYLQGNWSNAGTILIHQGSIRLGGAFDTSELAGLTISSGQARITGEVDATMSPLNIGTDGVWLIGDIAGTNGEAVITGSLNIAPGQTLYATSRSAYDGLTLDGRLESLDASRLRFLGDTTLVNGAEIHFGASQATEVRFAEVQSVLGDGALVFGTPGFEAQISMFGSGELTIGAGVTLRTGLGSGRVYGGTLNNLGTIRAQGVGRTIHLSDLVVNSGAIEALDDGVIQLNPTELSGTGTVQLDGGGLRVEGTITRDDLPIYSVANGGWVEAIDSVDLLGTTWTTDGPEGGLVLSEGAFLTNGLVDATGGTPLVFGIDGGTLHADFLGELLILDDGYASLTSSTPLNGQLIRLAPVAERTRLFVTPDGLASGTAEIVFEGPGDLGQVYATSSGLFTIGSGITIRATGGDAIVGEVNRDTILHGTVLAQSVGHAVHFRTDHTGINHGTVVASPGSAVEFHGEWHNAGTIRIGASDRRSVADFRLHLLDFSSLEVEWTRTTQPGDDVVLGGALLIEADGALAVTTADGFAPTRGDSLLLFDTGVFEGTFDSITVDGVEADDFLLVRSGRLVSLYLPFFGDATLDGTVGIDDLDLLLANWGQTVGPDAWALGDFDGDGLVGQTDLALLQNQWGASTTLFTQSVPEPGSVFALVGVGCALLKRRRRPHGR